MVEEQGEAGHDPPNGWGGGEEFDDGEVHECGMAVKDPLQGGDGDNEWRELDPLLAAGWGHSEPSGQKSQI